VFRTTKRDNQYGTQSTPVNPWDPRTNEPLPFALSIKPLPSNRTNRHRSETPFQYTRHTISATCAKDKRRFIDIQMRIKASSNFPADRSFVLSASFLFTRNKINASSLYLLFMNDVRSTIQLREKQRYKTNRNSRMPYVLYEHRLAVFENRVLRRIWIFRPKRWEIIGNCKKKKCITRAFMVSTPYQRLLSDTMTEDKTSRAFGMYVG